MYKYLILLLVLSGCQTKQKKDGENLVRSEAPDALTEQEQGYLLPGLNHGLLQSPINIVTKNVESDNHQIILKYTSTREKVSNLGHTLQANYDNGGSILIEDTVFTFKQFHFHTPSEHHIDGITYPMEMHMVHQRLVKGEETPHYVVFGLLFKEGEENEFIEEFLSYVPEEEGQSVEIENKYLDVSHILDEHDLEGCYHYRGSLTTPPYSETVHWGILKKIYEASPEQIERINRMEGNNARHIQASYGRKVEQL
jgi:carbonic anhydrase